MYCHSVSRISVFRLEIQYICIIKFVNFSNYRSVRQSRWWPWWWRRARRAAAGQGARGLVSHGHQSACECDESAISMNENSGQMLNSWIEWSCARKRISEESPDLYTITIEIWNN